MTATIDQPAPSLLTPLTLLQVRCWYARLNTATEDLGQLLHGDDAVSDDDARAALAAMRDELRELCGDAVDEMEPAHIREAGAERVAAAKAACEAKAIEAARQLLADAEAGAV